MEEEKIKKININDLRFEKLTLEEQDAFNYFNNKSGEVTFETNIDGDKFFEALGITKEDTFENQQYKISTLLNLIVKQQEEIKQLQEDLTLHEETSFEFQAENIKLKKIIDLIVEMLNNHEIDEDICKQMGKDMNCKNFKNPQNCKNCIKKYFEKKVME